MQQNQKFVAVRFPKCGAEFHPAFEQAKIQPDGSYILSYPTYPGALKSHAAQMAWAKNKILHIRSWGKEAILIPGK